MAAPVQVTTKQQFDGLLASTSIVVTDFYADWCGPCKAVAPVFAQLSAQLSRPSKIAFAKVNTDNVQDVARTYSVSALPTFIVFKNRKAVEKITGADLPKLQNTIKRLSAEADADGEGGFGSVDGEIWLASSLLKGYSNVTDQVDVRGLELLNAKSDLGSARTLFDSRSPSSFESIGKGKQRGNKDAGTGPDWVESDTDEQLMLFVPFQSTLKIHSLQITSIVPPSDAEADDDDTPMRPKTIQLFINRANNLGFDEAEDLEPTQAITLDPQSWDTKSGTANVELRFVKFQKVYSLTIFIVNGDGNGERIRIDRIRIVGDSGEKRDQGKLEKIGDH